MRKQTIRYTSSLDALVAAAKRSRIHESRQKMDSEEFFDRYSRDRLSDDAMFVEWANDYRHYPELRPPVGVHGGCFHDPPRDAGALDHRVAVGRRKGAPPKALSDHPGNQDHRYYPPRGWPAAGRRASR